MNYEGESILSLAGGGGGNADVDAMRMVAFVGALQPTADSDAVVTSRLSLNESPFYESGYLRAAQPANPDMLATIYMGLNMNLLALPNSAPYGIRWTKPPGLSSVTFRISMRVTFFSTNQSDVFCGFSFEQFKSNGVSNGNKFIKLIAFKATTNNFAIQYHLDVVQTFPLTGDTEYVDMMARGAAPTGINPGAGYNIGIIYSSREANYLSVSRVV